MRSKDRLAELQQLAAAGSVYVGTVEPSPAPAHHAHIDAMFQEVERMRDWIHEINGNTQLLRRLHSDPTFHSNKQLQEQLEDAVSRSGAAAAALSGALRSFEATRGGEAARRNDAASRIARLQYAATRALYADALASHHAALAALRDDRQRLLHEQIKLTNLTISDEECESLLESRNLSLFVDNVEADTAAARRVLRAVEARHAELARVETALRDVRDLFQQLALLVVHQQEAVERVEYYALQATEHVDSGQRQLLKGTVSRTRARKKKMSLVVCLAVGFFVVLLVLVYT